MPLYKPLVRNLTKVKFVSETPNQSFLKNMTGTVYKTQELNVQLIYENSFNEPIYSAKSMTKIYTDVSNTEERCQIFFCYASKYELSLN